MPALTHHPPTHPPPPTNTRTRARARPQVIFMAPQERLDELRPEVAAAMEGRATLTTALEGMLEVGARRGQPRRARAEPVCWID